MEESLYQEIKQRLERLEKAEGDTRELVIDARMRLEGLEWTILRLGAAVDRLRESVEILKDEMRAFKDEMRAFKDEMRAFKDEMRAFKDETRRMLKDLNKRWGDLARKMGTMAEDLVAPGFPAAVERTFGLTVTDLQVRRRKRLPGGEEREFDLLAEADGYLFMVEVKTSYHLRDLEYIREEQIPAFRKFFPEYAPKILVPVIASFYLPEEIVKQATREGFLALSFGGEYLEFLNAEEWKGKFRSTQR